MNSHEPHGHNDIVYCIDDADRICSINRHYDEFAFANQGAAASSAAVTNRPLWDFISDPTTREIYKQALIRVRQGHQFRFDFRCDSPACRRMMQIEISLIENAMVEFRTRILAEHQRPDEWIRGNAAVRSKDLLRVCSWCNKIDLNSRWVEIEEAVTQLRIFEMPLPPAITHGICRPCHRTALDTLQR